MRARVKRRTAASRRPAPSLDKGRIVLIEDEKNIAELVRYNVEREGYRVAVASDGEEGLRLVEQDQPDIVLLDLLLPRVDGLEVCRRLKQGQRTRTIPIIMLTAKAGETDKVTGLELGADDYVTKPFSPRELIARIHVVLRRRAEATAPAGFRCGSLTVDWERHAVRVRGASVRLTAKEMRLLRVLVEARGRVLSRETLLDQVWGYEPSLEIETRTVDFHVAQLRRKLKSEARRITTVAGRGYQFVLGEGA